MADKNENIEKYKKELEKSPNDKMALSMLARIAIKDGRLLDASDYYEVILLTTPDYPEALYVLGVLYMKRGEDMIAIDYFKRLLSIGIENAFLYEYASMLDANNRREYLTKALKMYNESQIKSKDYTRFIYMALESYEKSEYSIAETYGNLALMAKNTVNAVNVLGCIYYQVEDYDKALSFFHDVNAKLDSKNVSVLCNIAYCYKQKKSHKMAIRYLEKAKEIEDENKYVYFALGTVYADNGDKKNASDNFRRALDIDQNYEKAKEALSSMLE